MKILYNEHWLEEPNPNKEGVVPAPGSINQYELIQDVTDKPTETNEITEPVTIRNRRSAKTNKNNNLLTLQEEALQSKIEVNRLKAYLKQKIGFFNQVSEALRLKFVLLVFIFI